MIVLSLFDGMSCGQQALERINCKVDKYFASEIDKHAIKVTMANYPDTIQLGDVRSIDVSQLPKIDLLLGGSPCQSFSFAGKRKGMSTKDNIEILTLEHYLELKSQNFEFEGQSYLFWEYMRILNDIKQINPNALFLLENVEMGEKWEKILSKAIGVNGIHINSALVSAQNRKRIYWTNIGMKPSGLFGDLESIIQQPKDKGIVLKDILEPEVDQKYYLSEVAVNGILKHKAEQKEKGFGFGAVIKKENEKMNALKVGGKGVDDLVQIVVHNTMPRSSKTGKGGTGPLSRNDGKTYCLDTGQTNALEFTYANRRLNETLESNKEKLKNNVLIDSYNQEIHDEKSITISTRVSASNSTHIYEEKRRIRKLTPTECERLQTVKDNFTKFCNSIDCLYICNETNVIKKWLQSAELKSAIQISQVKKQDYATNIIYDLKELEQLKEWLLIKQKNASTKDVLIFKKLLKDIALLITKDLLNTEQQNFLKNLFKEIVNVNIAIKPLEKMEEEQEKCVIDITKIGLDTKTLCTQIINAMRLNQEGITVELMVKNDTGLSWKIQSEETLNPAKLYIILTLIRQIIQSKIYAYSKIKTNIKSVTSSLNILEQNCLSVELLDLKMENISLNSDTQRYRMLGNGWTIDVIAHILSYMET